MITFRPHRRQDIPLRVKWLNNPAIRSFVVDDPDRLTTINNQRGWFDRYKQDKTKRFFTIYSDQSPIGIVGLTEIHPKKESAKLFIMIGEDEYRNRGIGQFSLRYIIDFAWQKLTLKKIFLEAYNNNLSALHVYQKTGFKQVSVDSNHKPTLIKMELLNPLC